MRQHPDYGTVEDRWCITHVEDSTGLRRITLACQGRDTHDTRERAQAALDAMSGPEGLRKVLSPAELASLDVREVPCWPGHHDPCRAYVE